MVHEIQAPNGMIYTIEAPDDASEADLFKYTQHLMEQEKAHEAKTGIIPAAKQGFQGALGSADVGIAGALKGLGFPEEAAGFEKSAKERQAKAQEAYEPTTEEDVAAAEARGTLPGFIANLRKNVSEPIGGMAGRFGPTTAAVMLGGVPGAALAGGAEYLTSAGEIQERGGSPEAAYTMAAPVAALNTVGLPLGPLSRTVSGLSSKVLGRVVPEVAEQSVLGAAKKAQEVATQEGLNALGQLEGKAVVEAEAAPFRAATKAASEKAAEFAGTRTKSQLAGDIATSTLGNVAVATPTVLAQEAMLRAASGEEQQTPEEMVATAKQMALLSPFFGALHGTMRNPNLDVQRKAMEAAESVRTRPEALAAEENIRNFAEPEVPEPTKRGATPVVEEPEAVAPEEVAPEAEPVKPVEPVQTKVDEALKAKEEAVAKHAEEPTPENAAEAIKSTIMHDAAEREAAKPVVEDTTPPLKAEEPKVSETPTDAESTLLADRYSTTRERQNLSLMDKVKDFTKNVVQRHADKWAPAMEKVGKQYGMYTPEGILNIGYLGHQFDQAANMMEQAAAKGGLRLREDGQVEIRQEPIKLHTGETTNASIVNMHKLINSLGANGKDIINEILRVKDEARQLKLDPAKASKKVLQNPQAFQEKVKAADQYIKENPVVQDIINMYRKVHEMQIDFHEQTGTIDKKLADFFRSQEDYSPRYEMREEVLDKLGADKVNRTPIGGMFTKTFKERTGADHEVNPLENIANQFTGDYMKSWYNHVKSHMADQFTKVGAAKYVGRTKSPTNQGNVAVLRNGKREFYNFENPEDLPAMQIAANSLGPLAVATKASHALRFGALSTPGFWLKELARNPLAATLTSDLGWLTPAHSMYEVIKILRGDNEVFHKLQNAGIVGSVDPVLDPREGRSFTRNLGTKVQDASASKKTVGALLRNVENIHTVFDAATKCAVYRMAYDKGIREGMSPRKADGYAITKARESFNHSVSGSSEMQRNARLLTPFFGSGINALELLRKSIMMPHIKESERAAYRQQFVNKAATVAMLSGAYAFMMAGDPEYERQKSNFKYSNILVPTGMEDHPYIGIALPPDMAFLHWLPNMMVQYTLGSRSGSDLWDDMKDQLKLMVPGGLAYTAGIPIPQAVKPLLEATMGKSSYSGQDIISKADQSKLPEERGEFTSSLTAKTIGKATGISPPIIDHLATGYLAEVGKMAMWASDAFLSSLGEGDGITKPEKDWTQTPGLGLQGVFGQHLGSQSLDDFYTHKEEADQLRKTFNDMQKAGASRKDDLKEFIDDKERMFKKNAATQMDAYAKQMTALENQNRLIMRSKLPEDEITRRVEANKKQRNELAKRANQYWAKQISSYASGGEIERNTDYGYGKRYKSNDYKGLGYFGPLQTPSGDTLSELSLDSVINGKQVQYPSVVPTLSADELKSILNKQRITDSIAAKALAHAKQRIAQGKSPFANEGDLEAH